MITLTWADKRSIVDVCHNEDVNVDRQKTNGYVSIDLDR